MESTEQEIARERETLLARVHDWLERPLLVLAFAWLAIFVAEIVWGTGPLLTALGYVIWAVFIVEFVVGFSLAPAKAPYLASNWLKALSLVLPALRVFRAVRVLRLASTARGLRLLRMLSSINRGMNALGESMHRRGFGYVLALTLTVTMVGAAGMYAFESGHGGLESYGAALWWTAMIMTTMGSEYWPQTPAGRLLCLFLALYAFAVFGYVTAALASFFIGRDAERQRVRQGE